MQKVMPLSKSLYLRSNRPKSFVFFPKQYERQLLFAQPQEEDNRRVILLNFFQEDPIQHFYLRTPIMIPQVSVDTKRLTRDWINVTDEFHGFEKERV